jgi:hypothetical protein
MRILEMVEKGTISSAEAIQLLEALTGPDQEAYAPEVIEMLPESEFPASPPLTELDTEAEAEDSPVPQSNPDMEAWRQWWRIPLAIGAVITLISGGLLYLTFLNVGYGFWFFCTWIPVALGFAVMALAWYSRSARWLHLRIYQGSGEWPQRIALSFPLPIRLSAWGLRRFGRWIPQLEDTSIDELLIALDENTSLDQPFYVEVEDDEDGDRVQVFIG